MTQNAETARGDANEVRHQRAEGRRSESPAIPRLSGIEFCSRCGVSVDLHDGISDEIEPWECGVAKQKVDLMDRFYWETLR